jgi:hypothetical protein
LRSVTDLEGLDIRNNKLKDLDAVVAVIKDLTKLKALYIDGNPCFPQDEEENRLKFIARLLNYFDPFNIPLKYLNGKIISIQEKCRSFKKLKNPTFNVERMKLELCLLEKDAQPDHTIIDLSGYEFTTLLGIQEKLPKLTHLTISNNLLKTLEVAYSLIILTISVRGIQKYAVH